jgi:hypothetical protein
MPKNKKRLLSNEPPPTIPHALWQHFSDTYFSLRMGLTLLGFVFPVWLYFWGKFAHGLPLQPSMSSYFFAAMATAEAGVAQCAAFPMRTYFVGGLFAIAAGLYVYKGLTNRENLLLNLAAVCAVFVAIFPERITPQEMLQDPRIVKLIHDCPAVKAWVDQQAALPIHFMSAAALLILLGIVAWQCAYKSLEYLPADSKKKAPGFRKTYQAIAALMWLCPVTGFVLAAFLAEGTSVVFFVEMAGIWTFSCYWAIKTYELSLSELEEDPGTAVHNVNTATFPQPD